MVLRLLCTAASPETNAVSSTVTMSVLWAGVALSAVSVLDLLFSPDTPKLFSCAAVQLVHSVYVIVDPFLSVALLVTSLATDSCDAKIVSSQLVNEGLVLPVFAVCSVSGQVVAVNVSISDLVVVAVEIIAFALGVSEVKVEEEAITVDSLVGILCWECDTVLFAVYIGVPAVLLSEDLTAASEDELVTLSLLELVLVFGLELLTDSDLDSMLLLRVEL